MKINECKHAYKLRSGDYWCFNSAKGYFGKYCKGQCNCEWYKWYKEFATNRKEQ